MKELNKIENSVFKSVKYGSNEFRPETFDFLIELVLSRPEKVKLTKEKRDELMQSIKEKRLGAVKIPSVRTEHANLFLKLLEISYVFGQTEEFVNKNQFSIDLFENLINENYDGISNRLLRLFYETTISCPKNSIEREILKLEYDAIEAKKYSINIELAKKLGDYGDVRYYSRLASYYNGLAKVLKSSDRKANNYFDEYNSAFKEAIRWCERAYLECEEFNYDASLFDVFADKENPYNNIDKTLEFLQFNTRRFYTSFDKIKLLAKISSYRESDVCNEILVEYALVNEWKKDPVFNYEYLESKNVRVSERHIRYGSEIGYVECTEKLIKTLQKKQKNKNIPMSKEWFDLIKLSVSQNSKVGAYHYGIMYLNGFGVRANLKNGIKFLRIAQLGGVKEARNELAKILKRSKVKARWDLAEILLM